MGLLFDDISIEESEEYSNYKNLLATDSQYFVMSDDFPSDEELGFDINDAEDGFILSYGESKEVVPVGTFILVGYVDINNNPVDYDFAQEYGGICVFREIEQDKDGNIIVKQNGGRVVMSFKAYQAASVNTKYNNSVLNRVTSDEWLDFKTIDDTVLDLQSLIADNDMDLYTVMLRGSTLEDARANYDLPNNREAGLNYTFYPFTIAPKRINVYYEPKDTTLRR